MQKPAYSQLYMKDIADCQGKMFRKISIYYPKIDELWFIENYMKSDVRSMLDFANPVYASRDSNDLAARFLRTLADNDIKYSDLSYDETFLEWTGMAYSRYQWHYDISSKETLERIPVETMGRIFPALHTISWNSAIRRMHTDVLGLQQIDIDFYEPQWMGDYEKAKERYYFG